MDGNFRTRTGVPFNFLNGIAIRGQNLDDTLDSVGNNDTVITTGTITYEAL